jgi:predicted MarR family transcription regulator
MARRAPPAGAIAHSCDRRAISGSGASPGPRWRRGGLAPAAADDGGAAAAPLQQQQQQQRAAAVTGRRTVAEGRFLRLVDLEYTRPPRSEVPRRWQAVERCTTAAARDGTHGVDAVAVFAVVKSAARPPRLVVVKQVGTRAPGWARGLLHR